MNIFENGIPPWKDLRSIEDADSSTNQEEMIPLNDLFETKPNPNMKIYTGSKIFVRKGVIERLKVASKQLKPLSLTFLVIYGYRHPKIQESRFLEILGGLRSKNKNMSEEDLYSLAHNFVAVPEVAGHPTGGAVDLTLLDKEGHELDMGTEISDFSDSEKITTFSTQTTKLQYQNRLYLRVAMMESGFVPFNGEWWHFSYGEKEWAFWNGARKSKYNQIFFTI